MNPSVPSPGSNFAEGINLAILPTPMAKQAADVHAMTLKHTNIHNARWRILQTPLADDGIRLLRRPLWMPWTSSMPR